MQRHRDRIAHLMGTLSSIIPPSEKQDRLSVLERTIEHIHRLTEENKVRAHGELMHSRFLSGMSLHPIHNTLSMLRIHTNPTDALYPSSLCRHGGARSRLKKQMGRFLHVRYSARH